ncbi:MAG: penicillin-binding protein [Eubacterium sp.]|nr:penicillin-binding protein [Eubacterium sp.]
MKINKKVLVVAGVVIITIFIFCVIYIVICMSQPSEEIMLPENKTIVYAKDGSEYCTLSKYGRKPEEKIPAKVMRQFAGKEKNNIGSWFSGLLGIKQGFSASELLAMQLSGQSEYLGILKHAKYLEQIFPSENELTEYYCLSADFGNGVYGLDRAAVYYFGKKAALLSDKEISALQKISLTSNLKGEAPNAPILSGTFSGLSFNDKYKYCIIDNNAYISTLCEEVKETLVKNGYSYEQACDILYNGNLRIYSCLDLPVQSALDSVITNAKDDNEFQMAMQIMDYNGHIAAISGGIGNDSINRASVPRAVGSSIKPLSVYSPAIEESVINYSSLVFDTPFDIANGWPKNFDELYEGAITAAKALRRSKNTSVVWLADSMGLESCINSLMSLGCIGLTENDKTLPALSLGYFDSGISISELCGAYQVFGNGGIFYEPTCLTSIESADGEITIVKNGGTQVFSPQTAYIMNRMMVSNVELSDGLGIAAHIDNVEVFGKTGTTDNSFGVINNKTFAGGTPDYVGAIWIGSDDKNTTKDLSYIPLVTHVWNMVFSKLDNNTSDFTRPDEVTSVSFCCESGMLAGNSCPETEIGWYKSGEMPAKCDIHDID